MSRANRRCSCGSGRKRRNCCDQDSSDIEDSGPDRWWKLETRDGVILTAVDPARANIVSIGGIQIWRPNEASELRFRTEFKEYVRTAVGKAEFSTRDEIVRVLLVLCRYCQGRMHAALKLIGSQDAAEFFTHLAAQWIQVLEMHRRGSLTGDDAALCDRRGSAARRTLELVLEQLVLAEPSAQPPCRKEELTAHTDTVMIAGEWMVELALLVPQARDLHPEETTLSIDPDSEGDFFVQRIKSPASERLDLYREVSQGGRAGAPYEDLLSPDEMASMIDRFGPHFEADHGVSLRGMLELVGCLRRSCRARTEDGFPVVFVQEDGALEAVSRNAGRAKETVTRALAGLRLRRDDLLREPHEPWQPKKARRVVRRPLLSLPHSTGPHLCWSDAMIPQALHMVLQDISFGRMPPEWKGPNVDPALVEYLDDVRRRWADRVVAELRKRGLQATGSLHRLRGIGGRRVEIGPGEVDGLALDVGSGRVTVVEAKRLQPTYSPPEFADELDQFVSGQYVDRVLRKVVWVRDNWADVREHLVRWCGIADAPAVPSVVQACIVTKYESYAQVVDDRVPIVSGARLCSVFDTQRRWLFDR